MEIRPSDMTKRHGMGTGPLPIEPNISPEYFAREKDKLYRHAWLNLGRVEDVPNPGDFVVRDLDVLDTSIIIVRGKDKKIRAFHNMCQHRGNKVVHTGLDSGNCKGFSCTFHGWTYDLEGKLVIVPDEDQFFGLDKSKRGLKPVACEVWEGFIFVSREPKEDLKSYLGELYDKFDGYFDGYTRIAWYRAEVEANWKPVLDAFIEAYHAPFLHGKAYPDALTPQDNPLAHLLGFETYGKHRVISIDGNIEDHRSSPLESKLLEYTDRIFPAVAPMNPDNLPEGINPTRDPNWVFDGYIIFPNFYLAAMRVIHLVTYHFWPISENRCIWQTEHWMKKPETAAQRLAQEFSRVYCRDVQTEDLITLENTQSMLRSGAMTHMPISDQEVAVRHGYKAVEEYMAGN